MSLRVPIVLAALLSTAAGAQTVPAPAATQPPRLTLDRVFESPSLNGSVPRSPKLSPDGTLATLLRARADDRDRYDLWAVDTTTGQSRMLVDSAKVGSGAEISEAEKMRRERARVGGTRGIVDYDWAPDGKSILVPIDGDLYLAGLNGTVRRLTATPTSEVDAEVSTGGRYVSFVRDQDLYVVDTGSGVERRLTSGGGGTVTWGSAEFVAQEEMDRHTGHWWAPNDARIAVARVDESKVKVVTRASIGAEGTRLYEQRYPAAGTPNAEIQLYVMAPDGTGRVKVDLGTDPDFYLARVDWSKDGGSLYVQRESRDQHRLDLLEVDPDTGKSKLLFSETAKTWINLNDGLHSLADGSLIWMSERSGYAHLYRYTRGKWSTLTKGDWAVKDVVGVDEVAGKVYFLANRDSPIEQQLYSVDLTKPKAPAQLTEAGWFNGATMDKSATKALVFRSNPTQPPQVYLADAAGTRVAWIEENRLDATHPYAPYLPRHVVPVFGTLKAKDGSELQYKLLSPPREPGKKYPVFVQVYGGPGAGRQVTRSWGPAIQQYLVERGWIVFSIDGRGTPDRGAAFENQIYKAMGTVEVEDQLTGVNWLKSQAFVDPGKIAVNGWSYGGYMALKLLEKAPGVFAAGVSGAPVTRWGLYDTHYTERYMGNPVTDPKPYAASDALPFATQIRDPLLMLHGMADDNVVFENSTAFYAKLQEAKLPFEMMAYPGKTHGVSGEGAQTHVWRTITDFLERRVVGVEPPAK
ncbi:S9 family peptidase [Sphingomonas prati]|uniref:Dipeptidyl-peptidase-4 n=1 Tax=Sphingomonas prati TaxID=1843237 RepID=A0A7W9BPH5_9SPHN|nr:S9 family peptidase [Sphingomonas prati]MBB5727695.1 dipeptidyl-peptidase-4 [Sphingomonas prati]GGE79968.1 peptidase S9 [Sphingomonas prati]